MISGLEPSIICDRKRTIPSGADDVGADDVGAIVDSKVTNISRDFVQPVLLNNLAMAAVQRLAIILKVNKINFTDIYWGKFLFHEIHI